MIEDKAYKKVQELQNLLADEMNLLQSIYKSLEELAMLYEKGNNDGK